MSFASNCSTTLFVLFMLEPTLPLGVARSCKAGFGLRPANDTKQKTFECHTLTASALVLDLAQVSGLLLRVSALWRMAILLVLLLNKTFWRGRCRKLHPSFVLSTFLLATFDLLVLAGYFLPTFLANLVDLLGDPQIHCR